MMNFARAAGELVHDSIYFRRIFQRKNSIVGGSAPAYATLATLVVWLLAGRVDGVQAQNQGWETPAPGRTFCCASETEAMRSAGAEAIKRRFQIYKETGFDMLRVEGLDTSIQDKNGQIVGLCDLPYLQLARASGFRLKANLDTFIQPPWYFHAHPQSLFINEDGAAASGVPSLWDPGTRARVEEMTQVIFAYMAGHRLFDHVDYIAPDFGPASEPIYPAAWTQEGAAKKAGEAFWFYAPSAQADFVRAVTARYRMVATANTAWGTTFRDWSEVSIPKPGQRPGPFWNDVLLWYRDSKRGFVEWQIHNFQAQLAKYPQARGIKLLIYVPGTHYSAAEWEEAVKTGSGSGSIRLMCDSEFLLETAAKECCVLQYTGCENVTEVRYLFACMKSRKISVPMIGENAGQFSSEPERIAAAVADTDLAGIDYTHTDVAFEADTCTPSQWLPRIKEALRKVVGAKRQSTMPAAQ